MASSMPDWVEPLPVADPPAELEIYQLPTGTYRTRAAFAVSGGSMFDQRHFAANAILVRHPKGDVLVDAGFGANVAEHIAMLPRFERAPYVRTSTAREQLDAAGYDFSSLLGVAVTHVHWDHVSGLDSLDVPLWMNTLEMGYGAGDSHGAVFRAVSERMEIRRYGMDDGPYLGFPASWDVHGDGSVVIAHAGGHTPGSVVVFVALSREDRYAFIGDLTWQRDGITRHKQRPWFMRRMADADPAAVRSGLERCIALRDVVHLVPAHDLSAYLPIPLLPSAEDASGSSR